MSYGHRPLVLRDWHSICLTGSEPWSNIEVWSKNGPAMMLVTAMFKILRRFATFLVIRCLVGFAGILPRRLGLVLFGGLGAFSYRLLKRSRLVALANLHLVYGDTYTDKELESIARQAFVNLGKFAFDAITLGKCTIRALDRLVEITGGQHLKEVVARGSGGVGLTGHIGNWEFLGAYLARKGYPVNVLATRVRNERLDDLLIGIREEAGLKVLDRSRALLSALRCLKDGELLGVLMDQDTSVESVIVDFLGHPAKTPVGVAKLASSTGVPILPMAMLMKPDGTYRLEIGAPLDLNGAGDLAEDVARCSKALEEFILEDPTQWAWMHKRWKSVRPDMYA
jgi:KDO2-lipid IV(A) lauroyltransferase